MLDLGVEWHQGIKGFFERRINLGAAAGLHAADRVFDGRQVAGEGGLDHPLVVIVERQDADLVVLAEQLDRRQRRFLGQVHLGRAARSTAHRA